MSISRYSLWRKYVPKCRQRAGCGVITHVSIVKKRVSMKILHDPTPRTTEEILSDGDQRIYFDSFQVVEIDQHNRDEQYTKHLPYTDVLVSQQPMPTERLALAKNLKAIINVETNFLSNIDYDYCFNHGIHVLTPASVFALPVAEIGLGMALSLARDIHTAHTDFANGVESWGLESNARAELLSNSEIGIIGFGDLGQALLKLLQPFNATIRVYDPWLQSGYLQRLGVTSVSLEKLLQSSRLVFCVAAITTENEHLLNRDTLSHMQDNAMLVLLSRAAIADFDALAEYAKSGRLRIASDVFPHEPLPSNDRIRKVPNFLFSAHRAGALTGALHQIGKLMLEDLSQIQAGLPPMSCRVANRETIGRLRSKPVANS